MSSIVGLPEAPLYLTIQPGHVNVLLSWEAPKNDGGFKIDSYWVMVKVGGSNWCDVARVNSNSNHYTVENLKPGTPYRFGVTAENVVGRGPSVEVQSNVYLQRMPGIFMIIL